MKQAAGGRAVHTIGHSAHEFSRFAALLRSHRIDAVADVRSTPYSRRHPQFNRKTLSQALEEQGVKYVFLGRELGARSEDAACYENGRVQYRRLAQTELFRSGLQRVVAGSERMNIALMCAEKDPLTCHRTILVARELVGLGMEVRHILADGEVESHPEAMRRLWGRLGLAPDDLFRDAAKLDEEAYSLQERKIAYVDKKRAPAAQALAAQARRQ